MDREQREPESLPGERTGSRTLEVVRHEDYTTLYANHLYLEPTFWDLKIYFGELDLTREGASGQPMAEVHTGMSISWPLAKVLSYLLQANIEAHELENGKIKMPANTLPELPPPPPEDDPKALQAYEMLKKLRERFTADMT